MERFDFMVVGAGMAGASIAAELAAEARVLLIEREQQPGYHATGRSAAMYLSAYGNATVRALTRASGAFYTAPPDGFSDVALVAPRGALFIADADQVEEFEALASTPEIATAARRIDSAACRSLVPILKPHSAQVGLLDDSGYDLDVHAILQGYMRRGRQRGVQLVSDAGTVLPKRNGSDWEIETVAGSWSAPVLVNAAGAWADEVARAAGVRPVGLVPKRRTALTIDPPPGLSIDRWPMVIDAAETVYFKADAGRLLLSPADETPSEPTDAAPDELDIAIAIDRFETMTDCSVRRIHGRWAGLRTFAPDRSPVVGYAAEAPGFFWLAGQGGYGIQMAPALADFAAALALGRPIPEYILEEGLSSEAIEPARATLSKPRPEAPCPK